MYPNTDLKGYKPLGHMIICLAFISFLNLVTHAIDSRLTVYKYILHVSLFVYQTLINESLSIHLCCSLLIVKRWVYCVYFRALQLSFLNLWFNIKLYQDVMIVLEAQLILVGPIGVYLPMLSNDTVKCKNILKTLQK